MTAFFKQPWPWYISGPLIGLMVPVLLIIGNRAFGISSSLRHICAACFPSKIPFFSYDWKREAWNIVLVTGILTGGIIASGLAIGSVFVEYDYQMFFAATAILISYIIPAYMLWSRKLSA